VCSNATRQSPCTPLRIDHFIHTKVCNLLHCKKKLTKKILNFKGYYELENWIKLFFIWKKYYFGIAHWKPINQSSNTLLYIEPFIHTKNIASHTAIKSLHTFMHKRHWICKFLQIQRFENYFYFYFYFDYGNEIGHNMVESPNCWQGIHT